MSYIEIPHDLSSESIKFMLDDAANKIDGRKEVQQQRKGSYDIAADIGRLQINIMSGDKSSSSRCRAKKYSTISAENSCTPKRDLQSLRVATVLKSQSLPRNSSFIPPSVRDLELVLERNQVNNVLELNPEILAEQITILDMQLFRAIQMEEFQSCSWTKKDKCVKSANIVAFTRRFNNISFWTVQEILNGSSAKERAEIVSHFIKIAKHLYELKNLYSLFAIVSAMRTAAIFRMSKTWDAVTKKDKHILDKLTDIFSEKNNWENLRKLLENIQLPCIPYLGLFLTDLVYIDIAYPDTTQGIEPEQRQTRMNNVLRIISDYQSSNYSFLDDNIPVQKYLQSIRYIEELQNIFEEEQYKKSLLLEPRLDESSNIDNTSKESIVSSLNLSPAKSNSMRASRISGKQMGHRKCQSLGTNIFQRFQTTPKAPTEATTMTTCFARHLIDDSLLESGHNASTTNKKKCIFNDSTQSSFNTPKPVELFQSSDSVNNAFDIQGYVRRKIVLKDGKKPTATFWQRFWIQVWANSLIYFPPKSLKGCERSDFKKEPSKIRSLEGWRATSVENTQQGNTFQLINQELGHIYKFRTNSTEMTSKWLKVLQGNHISSNSSGREDAMNKFGSNLMTFE